MTVTKLEGKTKEKKQEKELRQIGDKYSKWYKKRCSKKDLEDESPIKVPKEDALQTTTEKTNWKKTTEEDVHDRASNKIYIRIAIAKLTHKRKSKKKKAINKGDEK